MFTKYEIYLEEFKDLLPNMYVGKKLFIPCINIDKRKCIGFAHNLTFSVDSNNCVITGDIIFFKNNKRTFIGFEAKKDGEICGLIFKEKES